MNLALTGFALVVLSLMVMFFMEDTDPYREFFPWAWKLAQLMFNSGVALVVIGLIYQTWRFFV